MQDFANRLKKMHRHFSRWARRQNISCYRIYDRDIPSYPFVIDIYDQKVYVAEFRKKYFDTEEEHLAWLDLAVKTIGECLAASPGDIYLKKRERKKGLEQYEKTAEIGHFFQVSEAGLLFRVNLSDYLDTGLFLDHRLTRAMVREEARQKHFLNLFAYTGSFSVYAAAGGAASTTTVDLSHTYLNWARENMKANGFTGRNHEFIQADTMAFLKEAASQNRRFDLVVADPPTFSNSKRMTGFFDVQRDHAEMLQAISAVCSPGARIYFSTNFRRFKPEPEKLQGLSFKDISARTIPPDFRNEKIHYCFLLEKPG